ncbi:MAG: type II toxin-antitoxin system VapC family toxin [Promicromonosporaceae bacterium]|nr:type II toxin-antitoxin system VapC family toxin [Promicromonosporaceae bacterium]
MIFYLDSSVVLHAIQVGSHRVGVRDWLRERLLRGDSFVSSLLLRTEVIRVLRRDGLPLSDAAPILDRVRLYDLSNLVATTAESFEKHIKTLDALHLATLIEINSFMTLASHDKNMLRAAQQLGLTTVDPVAELIA